MFDVCCCLFWCAWGNPWFYTQNHSWQYFGRPYRILEMQCNANIKHAYYPSGPQRGQFFLACFWATLWWCSKGKLVLRNYSLRLSRTIWGCLGLNLGRSGTRQVKLLATFQNRETELRLGALSGTPGIVFSDVYLLGDCPV